VRRFPLELSWPPNDVRVLLTRLGLSMTTPWWQIVTTRPMAKNDPLTPLLMSSARNAPYVVEWCPARHQGGLWDPDKWDGFGFNVLGIEVSEPPRGHYAWLMEGEDAGWLQLVYLRAARSNTGLFAEILAPPGGSETWAVCGSTWEPGDTEWANAQIALRGRLENPSRFCASRAVPG
jgi:hypothetical protein